MFAVMFGNQFPHCRHEFHRYFHNSLALVLEHSLIFSNCFIFNLRFIMRNNLLNSLFIPAGREFTLLHPLASLHLCCFR